LTFALSAGKVAEIPLMRLGSATWAGTWSKRDV
jgi:hypothetical protein